MRYSAQIQNIYIFSYSGKICCYMNKWYSDSKILHRELPITVLDVRALIN